MNLTLASVLISCFALCLFALICLTSRTRLGWVQICLGTGVYVFSLFSVSLVAGLPKPLTTEFRKVEVAEVLWLKVDPGHKIYLMLTWKDLEDPVYYYMPWDQVLANDLLRAQTKATANGVPLMMKNPFSGKHGNKGGDNSGGSAHSQGSANGSGSNDPSSDNEDTFYPAPPPPSPVKPDVGMEQ